MYLHHIILTNFKNIVEAELHFSPTLNVFYGDNGEGKTNLLDALHYLALCKSAVSAKDLQAIRYGEESSAVFGEFVFGEEDSGRVKISCMLKSKGEKIFKKDGKQYERLAEHIGLVPLVMISPSDVALVQESGRERRRFMNIFLSQTDKLYLRQLQEYEKLLVRRNAILKSNPLLKGNSPEIISLLQVMDAQLSVRAQYIFEKRKEFCNLLRPIVNGYYEIVSAKKESVNLEYKSDLQEDSMEILLLKEHERDLILGYTSVGVQRDDIEFTIDGKPLRFCGSQGQQKSFIVALKLAQFSLLRRMKGFAPILLLDDVFDKLDPGRVKNLFDLVMGEDFGQVFLTDSSKARVDALLTGLKTEGFLFGVSGGIFSRCE